MIIEVKREILKDLLLIYLIMTLLACNNVKVNLTVKNHHKIRNLYTCTECNYWTLQKISKNLWLVEGCVF